VSAIALLMGLLVLSYLGSLLVGTEKARGLASGIEYVGLGVIVGPHALGLVERPMIVDFEPVVQVALGWLAFAVGLGFGRVEGRAVERRKAALGIACATLTGALVAIATYVAAWELAPSGVDARGRVLLSVGAGAVSAETARNAIEWSKRRWGAHGPLSRLVVDIGASDDLVPLVAAGAIFALAPSTGVALSLPGWAWLLASLVLGALLGTVTALLLRGAEGDAVWGALIGTVLLGVGVAARFDLCTLFVTFVMGLALSMVSTSRGALRRLVGPTDNAVLYPVLLLAGARLEPGPVLEDRRLLALVPLVLLVRIAGKLLSGVLVGSSGPAARAAGPWFGIVMLSSGPVTTACGFVFALRFPGPIGDTLLVCAVLSALLGELLSTMSLKTLLSATGEIVAVTTPPPRPSSPPPPPTNPRATRESLIP
jgi:hypothetical protein